MAVRCVRPDRPALPALAVCGSGSGLPAEESPQEKSHVVVRGTSSSTRRMDRITTGLAAPSFLIVVH